MNKNSYALIVILLGSFLLCIFYSFFYRIHPVVDAKAYDRIGWNLAQGFGFREDANVSYEFDHAITRAGPGYEFFLAGLYRMFGHRYEPVWIAQALLHALSVFFLYCIARRTFREQGESIGLVAASLFAFWPDLIEISAMLMTETLYLFFTILVVYFFVRAYEKSENKFLAAVLGITTGLAILTRPPILLFAPVFIFFYCQKRQFKPLILYSSLLILSLAPWTIRNYLIYHEPVFTTMIGDYNLWLGNTLQSDGGQYNLPYNPLNAYVDQYGFFGLKEKARAEFWGFVFGHPLVFFKLCLIRFIRYFSLIRPMGFWFYQSGFPQLAFVASSLVWIAGVFVTGFLGMFTIMKEKVKNAQSYLIALALTAPILLLPTVVQSRYRFQIYPFMVLFAGYAFVVGVRKSGWQRNALFTIVFFFFVSVSDVLMNVGIIADRIGNFLNLLY